MAGLTTMLDRFQTTPHLSLSWEVEPAGAEGHSTPLWVFSCGSSLACAGIESLEMGGQGGEE